MAVNLYSLSIYKDGDTVSPQTLTEKGLLTNPGMSVKILGTGDLNRKLSFKDVVVSATAKTKIEKAGGSITE